MEATIFNLVQSDTVELFCGVYVLVPGAVCLPLLLVVEELLFWELFGGARGDWKVKESKLHFFNEIFLSLFLSPSLSHLSLFQSLSLLNYRFVSFHSNSSFT